ncbi:MAG: sugar phosphate isomerase/epimerase family protein [Planctomycetota bacterium]
MPILRIGIQTLSLRRPLRKALEAAGRLGADGVEIDLRTELPTADLSQTAIRQFRKLLEDHRLGVAAVAFPLRRGLADPADLDRRVAAVMAAMTAAAQLGARVLVAPIGSIPEADEDPTARGGLIESLTAVGAHGDRVGTRLAIAAGAAGPAEVAALLADLPEGVVGADLHPARLLHHGHDLAEAINALGDAVLHVHAADAVRDLAAGGGVVDVPIGRGSVDFPELLAALDARDYRGWLTIERPAATDPEQELGDAVAYLRELGRG